MNNTCKKTIIKNPAAKRQPKTSGGRGGRVNTDPRPRRIDVQEQIISGIPLFPLKTFKRRLRYCDTITATSTGAVMGAYKFAANGLYDPDVTGTGHQPAGFDQMMLSYNHFCVTYSRITATFRNQNIDCCVGIRLSGTSTTQPNINQALEDGRLVRDFVTRPSISGYYKTLEMEVDIGKSLGVPNVLDEFDLRGSAAQNPVEMEYFHVLIWDAVTGNAVQAAVDITMEFDAWFTEPRDLTQSFKRLLRDELKLETETPQTLPGIANRSRAVHVQPDDLEAKPLRK